MHSLPQAVIFDMDGLMLDTEQLAYSVLTRTVTDLGGDGFPLEVYRKLVGRSAEAVAAIISENMGEAFPVQEILPVWRENYRKTVEECPLPVKPGIFELLEFLEQNHVRRAVATSTALPLTTQKLKKVGLFSHFESFATADKVPAGKPAPDVYLLALRQLDLSVEHCLALEDSPNGVRAAHAAGLRVVMVPDMIAPTPELEAMAHNILPSLNHVRSWLSE